MNDPTPKNNQYRVTPENVVEVLRSWSLGESHDGVGREGDILNCAADRIEALEAENAELRAQKPTSYESVAAVTSNALNEVARMLNRESGTTEQMRAAFEVNQIRSARIRELEAEVGRLTPENARLREALEQYADTANWEYNLEYEAACWMGPGNGDGPELAQRTLANDKP